MTSLNLTTIVLLPDVNRSSYLLMSCVLSHTEKWSNIKKCQTIVKCTHLVSWRDKLKSAALAMYANVVAQQAQASIQLQSEVIWLHFGWDYIPKILDWEWDSRTLVRSRSWQQPIILYMQMVEWLDWFYSYLIWLRSQLTWVDTHLHTKRHEFSGHYSSTCMFGLSNSGGISEEYYLETEMYVSWVAWRTNYRS